MSPRALIGHAVFLVAALAFAWVQGHRVEEKKGGPTSTVLLDAKKGDVVKVVYTWPKGSSTVESKGADNARTVVVDLSREVEKKPEKKPANKPAAADAGPATESADAGTAQEAPPAREEVKFPGGHGVIRSLETFEPLKTRRTLGEEDAARLKAMGLDKPERSITVTTKSGKSVTLDVGESAYGGQGRYARVKGDSVVHLLEPAAVTGFEGSPETLMERRVVTADIDEIEGYSVRFGDKTAAFVQKDREQSAKRKFYEKDKADPSEPGGKLMTTLRNLRATKVADARSAGSAVATFDVDVAGRPQQKVEILERVDGTGHLVKSGDWLFEISETQSKDLLDDLAALWAS